jgi:hypothetical protein
VALLAVQAAAVEHRKTHIHAETTIEDKDSLTILSPLYWVFDKVPVLGPYGTSLLQTISSWIPPALIALPAFTLFTAGTTLVYGLLGYLAFDRLRQWWNFRKALKATHSGPVACVKEYAVCGKGQGDMLSQYITGHVIPFVVKQPGLVRYHVSRGLNNPNCMCVVTEWATLEDLRKCICSVEGSNIYKQAPWQVRVMGVKKCIVVPTSSGLGPAGRAGDVSTGRKVVTS